ncbi:hypothetical protein BJ165DRAFT_1119220 [Panaeolus papilionaceus]|nr:hypothetical protein BJ165DRAFT_1119220 [Panaeolus papilionaceus]
MSVLDLSTMWDLPSFRSSAVSKLSPAISQLSAGEQIVLGKKYQVKSWLLKVYLKIATDFNPVPRDELTKEGVDEETIHKLTTARDIWLSEWARVCWERARKTYCAGCKYPRNDAECSHRGQSVKIHFSDMVQGNVSPIVENEFAKELAGLKD